MKIVCDNCATKYSIADEKVRGKVFKIRCKKCSHIIVVRGAEGGGASQGEEAQGSDGFPGGDEQATMAAGHGAPQMAGGASDAVWHLVIDREQVGPLSPHEVREKFAAGEVDVETYAWREGFGDWLRLGSIEDFHDLGASAPAPAHHDDGATRRTDSADLFAASSDDSGGEAAGDLFGAGAAAPMAAAADSYSGGGSAGLFGAPSEAPAPRPTRTSSPGFAAQAAPAPMMGSAAAMGGAEADSRMTGQRNENSVLFSLHNLQALASGSGSPAAAKPGVDNRPGFANSQTEGSGLIDIRAMAASTLAAGPSSGSKGEDGPSFSAAPIFSPMAAPILMPAAPSGPPKWIWAVVGVGVLAVVLLITVTVVVLRRPAVVAVAPAANPQVAMANPAQAAPTAAQPVKPGAAVAAPTQPAAPTEAKTTAPAAHAEEHGGRHHEHDHEKTAGSSAHHEKAAAHEAPAPVAAPAPAAAKKHHGGDALDDLLNEASPDSPKAAHAAHHEAASNDANLPDQLDKGQIVGGMQRIKGRVAGCYDRFKVPGLAMVSVTIGTSGRVSSARTSGSFAGTPTGSCVEHAVKSASFPAFKGPSQTIQYPFMLR